MVFKNVTCVNFLTNSMSALSLYCYRHIFSPSEFSKYDWIGPKKTGLFLNMTATALNITGCVQNMIGFFINVTDFSITLPQWLLFEIFLLILLIWFKMLSYLALPCEPVLRIKTILDRIRPDIEKLQTFIIFFPLKADTRFLLEDYIEK